MRGNSSLTTITTTCVLTPFNKRKGDGQPFSYCGCICKCQSVNHVSFYCVLQWAAPLVFDINSNHCSMLFKWCQGLCPLYVILFGIMLLFIQLFFIYIFFEECAFNFEEDTFFSIQWRGLNANAVLNTVKPCSLHSCPSDLTLDALLSGAFDSRPGEATVYLREEAVRSVVGSVTSQNSMSLPRYLVLLDVFCLDGETALMGVNRAFPLVDHRWWRQRLWM